MYCLDLIDYEEDMEEKNMPVKDIDEYLSSIPEESRIVLEKLRALIKAIVPNATETIGYGMPVFKYKGKGVAGFAAFKDHCSYMPMSGTVTETLKDELRSYSITKGSIRFPIDKPLPATLVKKLIKTRIAEIT